MVTARIAALALGASVCSAAFADASYRLQRCVQARDGVALAFLGPRGEKRRMSITPRGVTLGGDVKGAARLSQVKEFELHPVLRIKYISGGTVHFGPIDATCQRLLREIAGPLVHIQA